jgi:hypothetical protein
MVTIPTWLLDPGGSGSARTAGTPRLVITVSFVDWASAEVKQISVRNKLEANNTRNFALQRMDFYLLEKSFVFSFPSPS